MQARPFVQGEDWRPTSLGLLVPPTPRRQYDPARRRGPFRRVWRVLPLVAGGPPCQGFSLAGRRNVVDPRNSLVFEFVRLVLEMRPKAMVMENVPGMISMTTPEGIPVVDALCRILSDGGFGGYEALKKTLVGAPAARAAVNEYLDDDELEMEPAQATLFAEAVS